MVRNCKVGKTHLLCILLLVTCILSFLKKGSHNLQEWDESRNGVNAYEMIQNKDYINFYFNGKLDTWNAKPPLMIWLITASYKVFGFNEFALRLPSTLAVFLFFIFCFYSITLLDSALTAFFTVLILMSGKAIFGNHIGLTGDFDALLLLFLTASVYCFILYIERKKKYAIYGVALFLGLAFYTKGPAAFVLVPGFIFYILFRKNFLTVLKDKNFWFSTLFLLLIVFSWFFIVYKYGKISDKSVYGSKNSIETMLLHDTFRRLTAKDFEPSGTSNHSSFFFFQVLDSRLNLWNYLFYVTLGFGIFIALKKNKTFSSYFSEDAFKLIVLSLFLIIPLSLILSFSANQHNWYLAPTFMFVAYLTAKGLLMLGEKWKVIYLLSVCLLVFTILRQVYYVYSLDTDVHEALSENKLLKNKTLMVTVPLKQDVVLYLKWLNVEIVRTEKSLETFEKGILILSSDELPGVTTLQQFEGYTLGEKN